MVIRLKVDRVENGQGQLGSLVPCTDRLWCGFVEPCDSNKRSPCGRHPFIERIRSVKAVRDSQTPLSDAFEIIEEDVRPQILQTDVALARKDAIVATGPYSVQYARLLTSDNDNPLCLC